jgi:hypothetical protein
MDLLFYSKTESIAFAIFAQPFEQGVNKEIEMLESKKRQFALCFPSGIRTDGLKTKIISESIMYKGMRLFWMETPTIPNGACIIGDTDDWTMSDWIRLKIF